MFKNALQELKKSPLNAFYMWQNTRCPWVLMASVGILLVCIAHYFFQHYLYMEPCEQCVYIRFAFFVMSLGGIIAAIAPKNIVLKTIGYILAFYGVILGIGYCLTLDKIHEAVHSENPFGGVDGCREIPIYPFNLKLYELAPDWFLPTGECGMDNPVVPEEEYEKLDSIQQFFVGTYDKENEELLEDGFYTQGWYLIPSLHFMNMAQACLIAFGFAFLLLFIMAISQVIITIKNKK